MVVAVPEFCYVHFQKAKLHFSHRREIDPYVRVTVFQGDCSYEHTLQTLAVLGGGQNTTLCAKNRNLLTFSLPKEACELYVAGGCNLRLRLEVFDEDLLTQDDFIGFCTVKLPLEEAESSKMTWNLTDIRYEPAGEIECNAEILMTDDGPRLNLEVLSLSHLMQMQVEESNSERRLLVMAFGMLLIYVLLGVFFYVPMEGWTIIDAYYFSVVTLTTTGYGDLLPTSKASKIFTCCFAFFGISFITSALSIIGSYVLSEDERKHFASTQASNSLRAMQNKPYSHSSRHPLGCPSKKQHVVWHQVGVLF
ncbi:hypothetical protein CYMTET_35484 [Cymbomonas tetramitiformis]|uniref:C2 domain-containing protein n=1 Tax=Cymbomonas tetramitiformis TaxID=36881 RepID=A0AAE0F938_9CHLO|nr:hypothetical protein CYMTET_35484 [Cymbomonas tetramitiformis]